MARCHYARARGVGPMTIACLWPIRSGLLPRSMICLEPAKADGLVNKPLDGTTVPCNKAIRPAGRRFEQTSALTTRSRPARFDHCQSREAYSRCGGSMLILDLGVTLVPRAVVVRRIARALSPIETSDRMPNPVLQRARAGSGFDPDQPLGHSSYSAPRVCIWYCAQSCRDRAFPWESWGIISTSYPDK